VVDIDGGGFLWGVVGLMTYVKMKNILLSKMGKRNTTNEAHQYERIIIAIVAASIIGYTFYARLEEVDVVFLMCFILYPLCFLSASLTAFLPVKVNQKTLPKYLLRPILLLAIVICSFICSHLYYYVKNSSPIILAAVYYDSHKTYMYFRENGTYKIRHSNMLTDDVEYGKYKILGNKIYLKNSLKLEAGNIENTMIITDKLIEFEFEKNCKYLRKQNKTYMTIHKTDREFRIS